MFGFVYFLFFWFFEIFCLLVPFIYILLFYLYVVYFKLYIYICIGNNESEKTFLLKRFQRNSSTVKISYINMFCTNLNYNFVLT